jgi:cytidine deaminase
MLHADQELIKAAEAVRGAFRLGRDENAQAGETAAALRSRRGRIYTGIGLQIPCGLGCCAEYAAILSMLKQREKQIESIVALGVHGVLSPCGACRELMARLDANNLKAKVLLPQERTASLRSLLPVFAGQDSSNSPTDRSSGPL